MRLGGAHAAVRRIWTVELRPRAGGPTLVCPSCTAHTSPLTASSARSAALAHLACHARADALPAYLRSCQCRVQGCLWHPRRRGCGGPVLLALTRDRSGRTWRLADTCAACAAATSHTAVVPDTLVNSPRPLPSACAPPQPLVGLRVESDQRLRVREMLTYLGAALPRFTSPAARLLGLQCALRTNSRGHVRLPTGLLRGMRLGGHRELWQELAHAGWLEPPAVRSDPCRCGCSMPRSWTRRPVAVPAAAPPTGRCAPPRWPCRPRRPPLRLTALVLAAHSTAGVGGGELDEVSPASAGSRHPQPQASPSQTHPWSVSVRGPAPAPPSRRDEVRGTCRELRERSLPTGGPWVKAARVARIPGQLTAMPDPLCFAAV